MLFTLDQGQTSKEFPNDIRCWSPCVFTILFKLLGFLGCHVYGDSLDCPFFIHTENLVVLQKFISVSIGFSDEATSHIWDMMTSSLHCSAQ